MLVYTYLFVYILVTVNLSPDSPNKKRKPGRPKKCDVAQPGVTGGLYIIEHV